MNHKVHREHKEKGYNFVYSRPKPNIPVGTTNHTNNTNKKICFFKRITIVNSFVKFVIFVVKEWAVGKDKPLTNYIIILIL